MKKKEAYPAAPSSMISTRYPHPAGWFYCHTYRENIHIIWNVTKSQVEDYVKKEFQLNYHCEGPFGGRCIEILRPNDTGFAQLIVLTEWSGDEIDHGILAHEAFHCAEHILTARGVKLSESTTEPFAYLIQEIVDRSLQIINRRPRPSK